MRRAVYLMTLLGLVVLSATAFAEPKPTTRPATAPATQPVAIEAYFTQKDEIAPIIVKLIDSAEHSLDVAAYTFSHRDIMLAIVRAHQRGVTVRFVMDYTQSRLITCRAIDLMEAGIEVRTRRRRGFQHNKYMIVDNAVLLTGSYNFSATADARNAENVLILRNAPETIAAFLEDHQRIMADTLVKED